MAHAILTGKSMAVIAGYVGVFYFLSRAYTGPWQGKFDMSATAREQTKDFGPIFESQFKVESHPALRKE